MKRNQRRKRRPKLSDLPRNKNGIPIQSDRPRKPKPKQPGQST